MKLPIYRPTHLVVDGIELVTNRLACCGSGPDRVDKRTTERLHLPGCPKIAAEGIATMRELLKSGDWTEADDDRVRLEELVDLRSSELL